MQADLVIYDEWDNFSDEDTGNVYTPEEWWLKGMGVWGPLPIAYDWFYEWWQRRQQRY